MAGRGDLRKAVVCLSAQPLGDYAASKKMGRYTPCPSWPVNWATSWSACGDHQRLDQLELSSPLAQAYPSPLPDVRQAVDERRW